MGSPVFLQNIICVHSHGIYTEIEGLKQQRIQFTGYKNYKS